MVVSRYKKTEWGLKVASFSQQYGLTLTEIARLSGVTYSTFHQVRIGKTPGTDVIPKVDAFMVKYAKEHAELNEKPYPWEEFKEARPCIP